MTTPVWVEKPPTIADSGTSPVRFQTRRHRQIDLIEKRTVDSGEGRRHAYVVDEKVYRVGGLRAAGERLSRRHRWVGRSEPDGVELKDVSRLLRQTVGNPRSEFPVGPSKS